MPMPKIIDKGAVYAAGDRHASDGDVESSRVGGLPFGIAPPDPSKLQVPTLSLPAQCVHSGGLLQQLANIELKLDEVLTKVDTLAGRCGPAQAGAEVAKTESKGRSRALVAGGTGAWDQGATDIMRSPRLNMLRPPIEEEGTTTFEFSHTPTNASTVSKKSRSLRNLSERVMAFTAPELKDVVMEKANPTIYSNSKSVENISEESYSPRRSTNMLISIVNSIKSEPPTEIRASRFGLPGLRNINKLQKLLMLDSFMGLMIIANIVILGVSADMHPDWFGWFIVDCAFLAVFSAELIIRLRLHGCRSYIRGPDRKWHLVEVTCLAFTVLEVVLGSSAQGLASQDSHSAAPGHGEDPHAGRRMQHVDVTNMTTLRVVRLLRIARILRVARFAFCSEMIVMINGIFGGLRTLGWACVLICLPLYAMALLFREGLGPEHESFNGVAISFFTVFECILGESCSDENGKPLFHHVAVHSGWGYAAVYLICTILVAVGLMNVIVAIFVENVVAAARTNEALMKRQRTQDKIFFANKMTQMVELITAMQEGRAPELNSARLLRSARARKELFAKAAKIEITPEFFEEIRQCPAFSDICNDLEVADEDHCNMFDTLDADGSGTIDIEELIVGVSKLRGDARRSDIIGVSLMVHRLVLETHDSFEKIIGMLKKGAADRSPRSPIASVSNEHKM